MKISAVTFKPLKFYGKIIDSHVHNGCFMDRTFTYDDLDVFIRQPLNNGDTIEKMLVSNLSCMDNQGTRDEIQGNLEVLELAEQDDRMIPLAACKPQEGCVENIKKLFREHPGKFYGLKFHPGGSELSADDEKYIPYLKFAQKKHLPCLFHCAVDSCDGRLVDEKYRYSSPQAIYKAAQKVPDTPVILAHLGSGGEIVHNMALDVMLDSIEKGDAALYADISWVDCNDPERPNLIKTIRALQNTSKGDMTHRLLFGTDAPTGEYADGKDGMNGLKYYNKTVEDTKQAIRDNFGEEAEELIDKIFYQNAYDLYFA